MQTALANPWLHRIPKFHRTPATLGFQTQKPSQVSFQQVFHAWPHGFPPRKDTKNDPWMILAYFSNAVA